MPIINAKKENDRSDWKPTPKSLKHKKEGHDITRFEFSRMFPKKYGNEADREYVQHLANDLNGKFDQLVGDVQVSVDQTLAYFAAQKKKGTGPWQLLKP